MSDINRQIAELLGWVSESDDIWSCGSLGLLFTYQVRPSTDANQIDAAVREWGTPRVGPSGWRRNAYINALMTEIDSGADWDLVTATPEQKCRALLAAAEAMGMDKGELK